MLTLEIFQSMWWYKLFLKRTQDVNAKMWSVRWQWDNAFGEEKRSKNSLKENVVKWESILETTFSDGHVLETSCLIISLPVSSYKQVSHPAVFFCLKRYFLIKKIKLMSKVRYSLSCKWQLNERMLFVHVAWLCQLWVPISHLCTSRQLMNISNIMVPSLIVFKLKNK